jgi:biotin-dependent carboxylase-like uncharacterized protein
MELEIAAAPGLALFQDGGRPGWMHEGVPPGGALVPEWLARANAAAGNPPGAAGIEIVGSLSVVARGGAIRLGADDGRPINLATGERFDCPPARDRRAHYLAVAGGVEVPVVLGGRGTLLVARAGGFSGRPLRRGDRLPIGSNTSQPYVYDVDVSTGRPLRVVLGPDRSAFVDQAFTYLLSSPFRVSSSSDRTGTRLIGPPLSRAPGFVEVTAPMVQGAMQVPASGEPIVLGPDHPTTGGYPVIATIARADLGAFHATPLGADVRFTVLDLER